MCVCVLVGEGGGGNLFCSYIMKGCTQKLNVTLIFHHSSANNVNVSSCYHSMKSSILCKTV